MLLLTSTSDLIRAITVGAANVTVHASYMDNNAGAITPAHPTNPAAITTSTTTTLVPSPGSGVQRNVKKLAIRNTHASVSVAVEVQHYDGTNAESLWSGTLAAGEAVILDQEGVWTVYSSQGLQKLAPAVAAVSRNVSTSTVSAAFAADTYLAGSSIALPTGAPVLGTVYRCIFDMVKTTAGTAAFTVNVRFGTAGAIGDTSILSLAFAVGTAVVDSGTFELNLVFRSVGSGTSAVVAASLSCRHALAATGLITTGASGHGQVTGVSSGFNSTPSGSIIGISVNGGASFSGTNTLVEAELIS